MTTVSPPSTVLAVLDTSGEDSPTLLGVAADLDAAHQIITDAHGVATDQPLIPCGTDRWWIQGDEGYFDYLVMTYDVQTSTI